MRALANVLERYAAEGHPLEPLVEGLAIGVEVLADEGRWLHWDDLIAVMERLEATLGEERLGEYVAEISHDPWTRGVRASLAFAASPAQLYMLLVRWFGPSLYPAHRATLERRPGEVIVTLQVPERYRDSQVFFRTSRHAFRHAPRILGLPDAKVEAEISSHRATYRVVLPPSRSFFARLRRISELFAGSRNAIEALAEQQVELQRSYDALSESYAALQERERWLEAEIEQRRRAELALHESREQLLRAQRMEAMGRLAGGIAHDFNNLMTAVKGYTTMLTELAEPGTELDAGLHEIGRAAERATRLTAQLLAFSRRQVLQPQILDLNAVVLDMQNLLDRLVGDRVELCTALASDLPTIRADPGQMEQVILNLVVNARDAMPQGGRVTIRTHAVPASPSEDAGHGPRVRGPRVRLIVTDRGTGIDPSARAHIFEPFFTTKEHGAGTGLGLATVYGIVSQSGGSIEVESNPGEGTSFFIDLPAAEGEVQARTAAPLPERVRGGDETILVVEDEPSVRSLLERLLAQAGYRVFSAGSGEQALRLAQDLGEGIDLIVSDVMMRGMSGPELVAVLRAQCPGLRVLMVSGLAGSEGEIDLHRSAFLGKPFTRDELLVKVREALDAG